MTFTALLFLALAMSTDAFAAAIAKGAALRTPTFMQALRIGLLFGCIETITPVIGWSLGSLAADAIRQWDHWIAFVLLLGLGGRMIWLSFGEDEEEQAPTAAGGARARLLLVLTAVATSIDAMAVGVGLAFVDVSIVHAALAIGAATTTMVTIGVLLGRRLGAAVGRNAERIGGVVLVLVGTTILIEHLSA